MAKVSEVEVAKKLLALAQSARTRGIEFDLTFGKVRKLLERKTCFYTGVPFEDTGDLARSIDRVDNNRGYVDDNVVSCTILINAKKKDLTLDDIGLLFRKTLRFVN